MWPFSGLLSGLYEPPGANSITIYKAYVTSTALLYGPTGWTATRPSTGRYTLTLPSGFNLLADGVACWAIVHYDGSDNGFTSVAQIQFDVLNTNKVDIYTPRSLDGGEVNNAFYFYVAVGNADTVKKTVLLDNGNLATTPFAAPSGWTSSKISTGEYRVTPTGGNDLTPGASEAAIMVMPYGALNPTEPKQAAMWEPESGITTQMRISGARLLDGAIQDRDSYIVWIDATALTNVVDGVHVSGGGFSGTVPSGWTVSNPTGGLTSINPNKGNQPIQPVQDGQGWMASPRRGQTEQAGCTVTFDGSSTLDCRTFRLLDGAATLNKDFYFYSLTGTAPE